MVIPLTQLDGTLVDVERIAIHDVQPLGDGCVIYMTGGPPVRVMQSMAWVMALWKSDGSRSTTSETG